MRPFDIRNINRVNSSEWSKCNNDGKSQFWREWVCKNHGGEFKRDRVGKMLVWVWVQPPDGEIAKWIFIDKDGNEYRVNNFRGFCKEHGLDDGRMYNTYTGARKNHKGWRAIRLYGVEGKKNSRDFGRELPPPARS